MMSQGTHSSPKAVQKLSSARGVAYLPRAQRHGDAAGPQPRRLLWIFHPRTILPNDLNDDELFKMFHSERAGVVYVINMMRGVPGVYWREKPQAW